MPAQDALVVDDDPQLVTLMARWLDDAGFTVRTAEGYDAAREQLIERNADVLVVDVRLQEFNGIQLAILARELNPSIRILIVTGWDDPVLRKEAGAIGAAFLCKPLKAKDVVAAVLAQPRS